MKMKDGSEDRHPASSVPGDSRPPASIHRPLIRLHLFLLPAPIAYRRPSLAVVGCNLSSVPFCAPVHPFRALSVYSAVLDRETPFIISPSMQEIQTRKDTSINNGSKGTSVPGTLPKISQKQMELEQV
ncbi:hypothetical protein D9611_012468 [Ephemerocybe angulata]|uniref:Uncharacterized protein n=1 Tax=Ephemerocybe angulata TaxID=980116 RepID=A0A8H5FJ77_9AGAR|nr:hypothetical protein D9611_012468 [Tulosesus angulatus]